MPLLSRAVLLISAALFGIPGLLEHHGTCGWGWCAPTLFGWVFLCAFWLLVVWFLAWGLSSL